MRNTEIRATREAFGLSMAPFAKLCGVSLSTAYRWETTKIPKPDPLQRAVLITLRRLAVLRSATARRRLGCDLEEAVTTGGPLAGIAVLHATAQRSKVLA